MKRWRARSSARPSRFSAPCGSRASGEFSRMTRQTVPQDRRQPIGARRRLGHVFPPIGAQGLNLGLRDVEAIVACAFEARNEGRDFGGPEDLGAYER